MYSVCIVPLRDHDESSDNCAKKGGGGWWYGACTDMCLNCVQEDWVYTEYDDKGNDKRQHLPDVVQMALRPTP